MLAVALLVASAAAVPSAVGEGGRTLATTDSAVASAAVVRAAAGGADPCVTESLKKSCDTMQAKATEKPESSTLARMQDWIASKCGVCGEPLIEYVNNTEWAGFTAEEQAEPHFVAAREHFFECVKQPAARCPSAPPSVPPSPSPPPPEETCTAQTKCGCTCEVAAFPGAYGLSCNFWKDSILSATLTTGALSYEGCPAEIKLIHHDDKKVIATCQALEGIPSDNKTTVKCTGTYEVGQGKTDPPWKSDYGCFAKETSTACLLASPTAECQPVLMADLVPGDVVLGRDGATTVLAVQHKAVDTLAEMLTFHTAGGASVSMTRDHAVFADGELVAAAQVKVGSLLSTGAVKRIAKSEGAIINAVTADGTIVADGILAASNPMWIASLTVDAPLTRAVVNGILFAVGDVDTVTAGLVKAAVTAGFTLGAVALAANALKTSSFK